MSLWSYTSIESFPICLTISSWLDFYVLLISDKLGSFMESHGASSGIFALTTNLSKVGSNLFLRKTCALHSMKRVWVCSLMVLLPRIGVETWNYTNFFVEWIVLVFLAGCFMIDGFLFRVEQVGEEIRREINLRRHTQAEQSLERVSRDTKAIDLPHIQTWLWQQSKAALPGHVGCVLVCDTLARQGNCMQCEGSPKLLHS